MGLLKIARRRKLYTWNAGGRNRYRNEPGRESGGKNFVDFRGELKIEIADALNAVGIEIDDDLVPDVEPLRMMIHRFGNESDLGHPAKSGDEVLALKRFVQFAVDEGPAVRGLEMNLDFGVGEFLRFHGSFLLWRAGSRRNYYALGKRKRQGFRFHRGHAAEL